MYFFYDDYSDRRVNENVSHLNSNGHLDSTLTNGHLESCISKQQISQNRRRSNSLESKEKQVSIVSEMISEPVIICPPKEYTKVLLEDVKSSSEGETNVRRNNISTNPVVSQFGSLEIVMEDSINMKGTSSDSDTNSIILDWPCKKFSAKPNLPSLPVISRRHSVSVTPTAEFASVASMAAGFAKHRHQRRRSIVWADETKTCSLETVHFIAKRSTSLDQISMLKNWFREKCNSIRK